MIIKLSLIAAALLGLTAVLYTDIRERRLQEQEARKFIQQVQKQPVKTWGNSAKTIQSW